jgi:hypothetical protein
MISLSSKERVCDESGEFSTDSIGDFIADLHTGKEVGKRY